MAHPFYTAFHVLWTKPSTIGGHYFSMNNAEIMTMIISALMWQKYNGTIKLYTDKAGYEFIREHDLLWLWNGGIDTDLFENNNYPIDPEIFWAAGKLMALEAQETPCVMLDTDLIVVRPIHELLMKTDIMALHTELLDPNVYLSPVLLKQANGFNFPAYYDWEVLPSNTAFLYVRDKAFKNFYLSESKRFMFQNTEKPAELVSQMVFAEQRLLSICAAYCGMPVNHLLADPFSQSNETVIHLWGFKSLLRQNENLQAVYCNQLIKTIGKEFITNRFFQEYVQRYFGME
jgi:hypothetical protein